MGRTTKADAALKKGSAEMLVLSLLERRARHGLIQGRWVEKAGQRRKRHYSITPAGRRVLAERRSGWTAFIDALTRVAGLRHA
jgi:DNA-binding PadR family transcriptional regulator